MTREAGARPLDALRGKAGWQIGILGMALSLMILGAYFGQALTEIARGEPIPPIDFIVFWGAAKLAAAGEALAAFDIARLEASHGAISPNWLPWVYPPGFLAALEPLGHLSFGTAWMAFTAVSLGAYWLALRPFAGALPVWLALAFAPALWPAVMLGQTTLLWMAGLLGALWALRDQRPILAGVLIGLLTLKPQLGILLPVVLLAIGAWRAIAAAIVTALALAAVGTLAYGAAYWPAFLEMGRIHAGVLTEDVERVHLMPSVYAAVAGRLGAPTLALVLQWGLTLAAAVILWLAWRGTGVGRDLRMALLVAAIPLSTPYLWYYDTAFSALTALFLMRAGVLGLSGTGLIAVILLWLGAGPPGVAELITPDLQIPVRALVAPVLLMGFALAALAALRALAKPAAPA